MYFLSGRLEELLVGFNRNLFKFNVLKITFTIGDIQHSKMFVKSLRPNLAAELKILCSTFLTSHLPQTGFRPALVVTGDCGTYKHHTRQFVGM